MQNYTSRVKKLEDKIVLVKDANFNRLKINTLIDYVVIYSDQKLLDSLTDQEAEFLREQTTKFLALGGITTEGAGVVL